MSNDTKPAEITAEVPIEWTEWVLPTPRHRKRQPVTRTGTEMAGIRAVSSDIAPLAFTIPEDSVTPERGIRSYNGDLYVLVRGESVGDNGPVTVDEEWLHRTVRRAYLRGDTDEPETRMVVAGLCRGKLAIDGVLWARTVEPRYLVATFGFGGNHGGTALMYDGSGTQNHGEESYYLADEFEQAMAAAVGTAEARGDDKSIERIRSLSPIVIHDRSWVGSTATRVIRLDLPEMPEDPAGYPEVRARFIHELSKVPGAIFSEGVTGIRRVDRDKLTYLQRWKTEEMLEYPAKNWII